MSEINKTRKIQGKIKSTVFGKFNQKGLFGFHKAHTKEGSISMGGKKKKEKEKEALISKVVLGGPENHLCPKASTCLRLKAASFMGPHRKSSLMGPKWNREV